MDVAEVTTAWQTVGGSSSSAPGPSSWPEEPRPRQVVLMCVGLVGSGKSTVASAIEHFHPDVWVRCNQDELRNRQAVESRVRRALQRGQNAIVDRTNVDIQQRSTWIDIARDFNAETVVLIFDTPFEECYQRLQVRTGHPTLRSAQQASSILLQFARQLVLPLPGSAGIHRIVLLPPSSYSPQPTAVEIADILRRTKMQPNPSRAEVQAAQARARMPPGFSNPGQGRAPDRYRQQRLAFRPVNPRPHPPPGEHRGQASSGHSRHGQSASSFPTVGPSVLPSSAGISYAAASAASTGPPQVSQTQNINHTPAGRGLPPHSPAQDGTGHAATL